MRMGANPLPRQGSIQKGRDLRWLRDCAREEGAELGRGPHLIRGGSAESREFPGGKMKKWIIGIKSFPVEEIVNLENRTKGKTLARLFVFGLSEINLNNAENKSWNRIDLRLNYDIEDFLGQKGFGENPLQYSILDMNMWCNCLGTIWLISKMGHFVVQLTMSS